MKDSPWTFERPQTLQQHQTRKQGKTAYLRQLMAENPGTVLISPKDTPQHRFTPKTGDFRTLYLGSPREPEPEKPQTIRESQDYRDCLDMAVYTACGKYPEPPVDIQATAIPENP